MQEQNHKEITTVVSDFKERNHSRIKQLEKKRLREAANSVSTICQDLALFSTLKFETNIS